MAKQYRDPPRAQHLLFPPSLEDLIPENHLARFVVEVVDGLDISLIEAAIQAKDPRGNRPYAPRPLLALLIYGTCVGVRSSRLLAKSCVENVAFRFIMGHQTPHFTVISDFRLAHLDALPALFSQVVKLAIRSGHVKGEHVYLDGTKMGASASKHRAMSHERMLETERRLEEEIAALLRKGVEEDAEDDRRVGKMAEDDRTLADEVQRRETRKEWIRRQREALEKEAREGRAAQLREQAEQERVRAAAEPTPEAATRALARAEAKEAKAKDLDDPPPPPTTPQAGPRHRPKARPDGTPKPKAQRNFTDPDSRIVGNPNDGFRQGYNGQVVVDENHIIVAHGLTNQPADAPHVEMMLSRTLDELPQRPRTFTTDAGFYSEANAELIEVNGVRPYLAVDRERRTWPPPEPAEGAPPTDVTARQRMRWMLQTPEGRERMRKRKSTVELVFGCIKEFQRARTFLLRSLRKVQAEWALLCLSFNVRRLAALR